jgi:hypothetical protein
MYIPLEFVQCPDFYTHNTVSELILLLFSCEQDVKKFLLCWAPRQATLLALSQNWNVLINFRKLLNVTFHGNTFSGQINSTATAKLISAFLQMFVANWP